jgi:hemerythrin-like domain-containing protein
MMIHPEEINKEETPAAATFDPTDLKYRVSDEFPPDKESTWPYPPEKSGWFMAHNCLRGMMEQFQDCLTSVRGRKANEYPHYLQVWQVDCLQELFAFQYDMVKEHHTTEDNILAPEFLKRFKYPDKLVDDHEGIIKLLDKVNGIVKNLKPGADAVASIDELIVEFEKYSKMIRPHFEEEESVGLLLSRAYFEPKELAKIMKKGHNQTKPQPEAIGCFIYFNGTDNMRKFIKQEGIPIFVWYLVFWPGYKKYCRKILPKVNALKNGAEPVPEKRGLFSCFF